MRHRARLLLPGVPSHWKQRFKKEIEQAFGRRAGRGRREAEVLDMARPSVKSCRPYYSKRHRHSRKRPL